jgi:ubiquinone/menaquinone biosynthesis C-methylase UbiE
MANKLTYILELYRKLPQASIGNDDFTRKAFSLVKELPENPKIVNLNCGEGRQTLELARLSKGNIIAVDDFPSYLDKLKKTALRLGLDKQIETLTQPILEINFESSSIDIIWAEGTFTKLGFEKGLKQCREFLKQNGYIAVTEIVWLKADPPAEVKNKLESENPGMTNIEENLKIIKREGYELSGHFTLPHSPWRENYINPLQERVNKFKKKYEGNETALEVLQIAQSSIDSFNRSSPYFGYEFFVARKI